MEIWIIRDGEKAGPFHDFEIRRQIGSGELMGDVSAWHEGLSGWKPLKDIPLFQREFEALANPPAPEPPPFEPRPREDNGPLPPPLPRSSNYVRRFWARWMDMSAYCGLWWIGMWAAGQNIEGAMLNPWLMFFLYVPWFVFETLFIAHRGTTPGKWLLGLRVVNEDGSRLDLAQSTRRSARVLFAGVGFGWELLSIFCQALSLFTARRIGKTMWDFSGGHRVEAAELHPVRLIALICIFFAAIQLKWIVQAPVLLRFIAKENPELKEMTEKYPVWYLPERNKHR